MCKEALFSINTFRFKFLPLDQTRVESMYTVHHNNHANDSAELNT